MTEHDTKYWELFIKKQSGNISEAEQKMLDTWVTANDENASKIHEFQEIYTQSDSPDSIPVFDPHEDWQELKTMIKVETESRGARQIRLFPRIARIAAAVLLILGLAMVFYYYQQMPSTDLNLQNPCSNRKC